MTCLEGVGESAVAGRAPNACGLDGSTLSRFQASAMENGVAVAMANHAAGYRCCNGMSVAFDHLGRPLVAGGHGGHEEQVRTFFDPWLLCASTLTLDPCP